ncbi:MAG TPA: hypothetical protein VKX17_18745 [Planctomycetota bacterium]|nr:hypothetical protein [Planctomycetota bacterium]
MTFVRGCCLAALLARAIFGERTNAGENGGDRFYTSIERVELDTSARAQMRLHVRLLPYSERFANGSVARWEAVHLKWMSGGKTALETDLPLPAAVEIYADGNLVQLEAGVAWREVLAAPIPTIDGDYELDVTPKFAVTDGRNSDVQPRRAETPAAAVAIGAPVARVAKKFIYAAVAVRTATGKQPIAVLDGSPSATGSNQPVRYQWRQSAGENLSLNTASMARDRVGLRIYKAGYYKFELVVTDAAGLSSAPGEVVLLVGEAPPATFTVRFNRNALFRLTAAVLILGLLLALALWRWFRVHLSTCVGMLLATGGLLAASSRETFALTQSGETGYTVAAAPGWPRPLLRAPEFERWDWTALALDALVAVGIIVLVALIMELLFKRRGPKIATSSDSSAPA